MDNYSRNKKYWYSSAMWLLTGYLGISCGEAHPGYGIFGRVFLLPFFCAMGDRTIGAQSKQASPMNEVNSAVICTLETVQLASFTGDPNDLKVYIPQKLNFCKEQIQKSNYYQATKPFLQCLYHENALEEDINSQWKLYQSIIAFYTDILRLIFISESDKQILKERIDNHLGQCRPSNLSKRWKVEHSDGFTNYEQMALLLCDNLLSEAFCIEIENSTPKRAKAWRAAQRRAFDSSALYGHTVPSHLSDIQAHLPMTPPPPPTTTQLPNEVFYLMLKWGTTATMQYDEIRLLVEFMQKTGICYSDTHWHGLIDNLSSTLDFLITSAFEKKDYSALSKLSLLAEGVKILKTQE